MDQCSSSSRREDAWSAVRFDHFFDFISPHPNISFHTLLFCSSTCSIFEHAEGIEDCLRLILGDLPQAETGPAAGSSRTKSLLLSSHYARVLADLAYQRGFDGYLLNVEVPLEGGAEQTRALSAWISLLQHELLRKVGAHAEAIWSVAA